ncbi:KxYKxGKxW signal peptide [Lacticaseibacillus paracasei]|uniref:KxYKxGKxW signal peptide n=1 Tax=Lacticaseibacillus paracasei TaxID=1597 RepID=A0A8B3GNK2_LACPA|nr:KxYKxGKxW signal peptide [Lacticaseibacillus paracasei]
MLYNRFTEHVVNDRKKMYKRGSQWVVASAFVLLFGGAALNFPAQTVDAATLTVSPVTLTKQPNGTVTASSTHRVAQQLLRKRHKLHNRLQITKKRQQRLSQMQ